MPFYENFVSLCNSVGKAPTAAVIDIGLERSSVTRWKRGGKPSDATLRRVADYFGTTPEALLRDQRPAGDEALKLIPGYLQLTPENQQKAVDYVALLLSSQQRP